MGVSLQESFVHNAWYKAILPGTVFPHSTSSYTVFISNSDEYFSISLLPQNSYWPNHTQDPENQYVRGSFITCLKDFPHLRNSNAPYFLIFVGFSIFIGPSSRPISVFWITDFPFLSINSWPDSYRLSLLSCFLPLLSTSSHGFQLFGFYEGLVSIELICTFLHPLFLNIKKYQGHVSHVCWNLRTVLSHSHPSLALWDLSLLLTGFCSRRYGSVPHGRARCNDPESERASSTSLYEHSRVDPNNMGSGEEALPLTWGGWSRQKPRLITSYHPGSHLVLWIGPPWHLPQL